jgi:hypothetical protein
VLCKPVLLLAHQLVDGFFHVWMIGPVDLKMFSEASWDR